MLFLAVEHTGLKCHDILYLALVADTLLREHCRYLAVRCGLAVALDLNVSGQQERTPLERLQPASLAATYKFLPKRARLPQYKVGQSCTGFF